MSVMRRWWPPHLIGALVAGMVLPASPAQSSPRAGSEAGSKVGSEVSDVAFGASGVSLSHVRVNGIRMRVAEQGVGPIVLMLHGFPESWYSWRHQLRAVAAAGYRGVAPDMRGYGETDAPDDIEKYDVLDLCGDVTGLLDHFGEEKAVLVGHDWGAAVAWYCVLLEPQRFSALVTMSVPWGPRSSSPPLPQLRQNFGENFFYMLYFQEPGVADAELGADPRGLLTRFLASPGAAREPARITDPKTSAGGLIGRIGAPLDLPSWLSREDLDYYVAQFTRTGFSGGLNYYRNLDRNWELTPQLEGAVIEVPTLFIAGEKDIVLRGRDAATLEGPMRLVAGDLRGIRLIPDAGHWIQQERADEVNAMLVDFLREVNKPGSPVQPEPPNPKAPPETVQFTFLVGSWDCRTRFQKPDGSGYAKGSATWTGYYILDGWAIQDDWVSTGADGKEFHGTNIRSFNQRSKKWDNRWLPAGSLEWKYFEAEEVGDAMVMIGGEGRDARGEFIDRNVFHDINPDRWSWRKDRSYDGGETWVEGVGFIEATRTAMKGFRKPKRR